MSKDVGLTTDGTNKSLTSWSESTFYSQDGYEVSIISDIFTGTSYYYDIASEKYIQFTGDYDTFIEEISLGLTSFYNFYISNFKTRINSFINEVVTSYHYDDIQHALSYYNSGITAWRNEAIAFNTWRDNTETLMYDNIFSYTADGITLPDLAGFTAQAGYFDVGITPPSRPNLFS